MNKKILPDKKLFTKTLLLLSLITLLALLIPVLVNIIIYFEDGDPFAVRMVWMVSIITVIVGWVVSVPLLRLWIKNLIYFIEDDRVMIHKGILTKTEQNIPYRAVTDFVLHRSLFDRILGIGSIKIQTAGQSHSATGYEGNISGLINYNELHRVLREKLKSFAKTSGPLTTDDEIQSTPDQKILEQILLELKTIRKILKNN